MLYAIFFDQKVQSFKFQFRKVFLSLENFTENVFLLNLIDFYQKRRPRTGVRSITLLHDNAPAHKSATLQECLKESGLDVLDHPPYSPDLSPVTFGCSKTKGNAGKAPFWIPCGIGSADYRCLQHIPKEDYRAAFRKCVDWCKMCVEADGAYFEGHR